MCIYSYSTIDVLADVSGFFPAGSGFTPIPNPARILDTRPPTLSPPTSPDPRGVLFGGFDLGTFLAISYFFPIEVPAPYRAITECVGATPDGVCALRKVVSVAGGMSRSEAVGECHVLSPALIIVNGRPAEDWIRDSNCDQVPDDPIRPDEPTPRSNERICVGPPGGFPLGWLRVDQYYPLLGDGTFSDEPVVLYFCPR